MSITTSDEAINRVLLSEKEAREQVELCRHKAALIITSGRERVRRIMSRADERISKVHAIADRITARTLTDINIDTTLLSEQEVLDERKQADVDKAINLLIVELIGTADEH